MSQVFQTLETPAMQEAKRRARESFPFFWRELSWEKRRIIPALAFSAVKLAFPVPQSQSGTQSEHMWVSNLDFDGTTLSGTLMNTAEDIPGMVAGRSVSAPVDELEDWMLFDGNVVCGGFTVQAMRSEMSEAERRQHDEAWGLPFAPPELCNITPCAVEASAAPKGLGRLFKKTPPPSGMPYDQALAHARANEHPMSENMRDSYAQGIRDQPQMLTHVLDNGLTLLHMDALGGNLVPVEAMLAAGADRDARTPDGRTALELAEVMGWPRVVAALKA